MSFGLREVLRDRLTYCWFWSLQILLWCFCSATNCLAVCLPLLPVCLPTSLSRAYLCLSIVSLPFSYRCTPPPHTHTQKLIQSLGHYSSENEALLCELSSLPQATHNNHDHLTLFLSVPPPLSFLPICFHTCHVYLILLCHSPTLSPHLLRFFLAFSAPLFFVMFCHLSPPHRRGEWISKLIPDSCSGW